MGIMFSKEEMAQLWQSTIWSVLLKSKRKCDKAGLDKEHVSLKLNLINKW